MGTGLVLLAVCLVGVAVWAGAARAEAPDREANLRRARQHFIDGKKAFEEKRYPAALQEFQAGYELEPKRGFLLDMGHAARKMGDLPRARELYQRFLQTDPPDAERRMAQQFAREIDRKLAQTVPTPSTPAPPDESETSPVASEPLEPPGAELPGVSVKPESLSVAPLLLAPVPLADESSQSQRDKPSSGRWWLWAGLAAVLAGTAAVLILRAGDSGDDAHSSGSWGQVKL